MGKKKSNKIKYEPVDFSKLSQSEEKPVNNSSKKFMKKSKDEDTGGCNDSLIEGTKDIDLSDDLNNSSAPQTPHKGTKNIDISDYLNNSNAPQTPHKRTKNIDISDYLNNSNAPQTPHKRTKDVDTSDDLNNSSVLQTPHKRSKDRDISENLNNSSASQTPLERSELQVGTKETNYENDKSSLHEKQIPFHKQSCEDSNSYKYVQNKGNGCERNKNDRNRKSKHNKTLEHLEGTSSEKHSREVERSLKSTPEHSDYNRKYYNKSYNKYQKGNRNSSQGDIFQNKRYSESYEDEKECDFLEEINQDLFKLPKEYSLAHCVAEDLRMGAGIAVEFKRIFGGVGKLFDQKLKVGDVGIVRRHEQNVFYLITKPNSSGKPTIHTVERTLRKLLEEMKKLKLTKLGIPTIGCGLDALDWTEVKSLIKGIFAGSGIHISVCIPTKFLDREATPSQIKVYISPKNLWEMEPETNRIIFLDIEKIHKNNFTDDIVEKMNDTYPFKEKLLNDIKKTELYPGDILFYNVKNETIICAFIKQSENYYTSLEKVFEKLKINIKSSYRYLAIQSGSIQSDDTFNHIARIVLILRSIIHKSELWLCGNDDQTDNVSYDDYCKIKRQSYSSRYYSNSMNRSYVRNNSSSFDSKKEDEKNWRPLNNSHCSSKNY